VDVERSLIGTPFEQHGFVRVHQTLKHFGLLATRFLHNLGAAAPIGLRQLRVFTGRRGDRHCQSDHYAFAPDDRRSQ
jgi:hypothetical protein